MKRSCSSSIVPLTGPTLSVVLFDSWKLRRGRKSRPSKSAAGAVEVPTKPKRTNAARIFIYSSCWRSTLDQPQFPLDLVDPGLDLAAVEGAVALGEELAAGGLQDGAEDLHLALAGVGGGDEVGEGLLEVLRLHFRGLGGLGLQNRPHQDRFEVRAGEAEVLVLGRHLGDGVHRGLESQLLQHHAIDLVVLRRRLRIE